MSLTVKSRVGKKHAVYLPKSIVEALDIREGEGILLEAAGDTLILKLLKDPLQLALSKDKFASLKPEEIEGISLEEQDIRIQNST